MRVGEDRPLVNVRTIQLLLTLLDILGQLVTGLPLILPTAMLLEAGLGTMSMAT